MLLFLRWEFSEEKVERMRWYLILGLLIAVSVACNGSESTATPSPAATATPSPAATATPSPTAVVDSGSIRIITTDSGLQYKDLIVGTGQKAQVGDTAVVHYTGWLEDGTQFDSSLDRGLPFDFVIGQGQVINPTFPIWLNIALSKSSAFFKPLSICETLAVGMAIITP